MKKYLKLLIVLAFIFVKNVNAKEITNNEFMKEFKVGWNLGNSLDSYYGTWNGNANLSQEMIWGQPKTTQEMIDYVLDKGINVIRIPVTWHNHTYKDENGIYHIHQEWLNRVKEVVDYAYNKEAYVIINTHHDDDYIYLTNNTDDFNNNVVPFVTSIWTEIAEFFKDYDEHLLFESYNEIFEKTAGMYYTDIGSNQINILNQLFVDIVRNTGGNNRTRLLMLPTLAHGTSQSAFEGFEAPNDVVNDKLILVVHYYSNSLDQDIESKFEQMKNWADNLNLPLVITEYGTQVSKENRIEKISNYSARAYKLGIRTIIWDNGSDFMVFNRNDLSASNFDVIDAIINPHEYNTKNKITLSNFEDDWVFARADDYGEINPSSRPEWWGTILTQRKEQIPAGSKYLTILLKNKNDARGLSVHQIYYYDENGNYISKNSSNYPGYVIDIFKIPENAVSFKLSIYDAKVNTSKNTFIDSFNSGDLSLTYGFISDNTYSIGNEIKLDGNISNPPNINDKDTTNSNNPSINTDNNINVITDSINKNISVASFNLSNNISNKNISSDSFDSNDNKVDENQIINSDNDDNTSTNIKTKSSDKQNETLSNKEDNIKNANNNVIVIIGTLFVATSCIFIHFKGKRK